VADRCLSGPALRNPLLWVRVLPALNSDPVGFQLNRMIFAFWLLSEMGI
jgi:hypothetical protein